MVHARRPTRPARRGARRLGGDRPAADVGSRGVLRLGAVLLWAAGLAVPAPLPAQADPLPVLDVPFVAQEEALCGGAALAMVLRYWGERGVGSEAFAGLLTPDGRGIPTDRLVAEARRRGWTALPFRGDREELARQVERGRPVVALLRVGPGRYHYVVVVASWEGGTAFHDPVRAPWRVEGAAAFDLAWEGAGRWAMVVLPGEALAGEGLPAAEGLRAGETASAAPRPPPPAGPRAEPCEGAVRAGVRLARTGRVGEAASLLAAAAARCPGAAGPARELAGLRLREGRPEEALGLAESAVARAPRDPHALRTLAAARYLAGDPAGALAAWGRAGEATLDLVRVAGLERTRHGTVAGLLGLEPGERLTPAALGAARRRLATLPAAASTRLGYRPVGAGSVEVRAGIVERPLAPLSPPALAATGIRALAGGELALEVAGPTGAGEVWRAAWRPSAARPRLEVGVSLPARLGVPAIWRLSASREREAHASSAIGDLRASPDGDAAGRRRRLALEAESWASGWLRWSAGVAVERWEEEGPRPGISGGLEARDGGDRASARLEARLWRGVGGSEAAVRAAAALRWRSRAEARGAVLGLRADAALAPAGGPRFLWPGAGTGRARPTLLRAHPLVREGRVGGPALGPRLVAAGAEAVGWLPSTGLPFLPARLGFAAFLDAAEAWGGGTAAPPLIDAGVGVRLAGPGASGRLRIDLARGLADGATALSAGWEAPWPGR